MTLSDVIKGLDGISFYGSTEFDKSIADKMNLFAEAYKQEVSNYLRTSITKLVNELEIDEREFFVGNDARCTRCSKYECYCDSWEAARNEFLEKKNKILE